MNHNNPNLNYHLIGSSLGLGQQHFPPIFKSNSINNLSNIPKNQPRWIPQSNHPNLRIPQNNPIPKNLQEMHHHQITLDHPLIHQNPNPPTSSYHMMNWDFGPNQNPMMNNKEVNAPSLFSAQHQHQSQSCAAISATALLQRAAQIGSTTTTTDSSNILGKFGRDEDGDKLCGLYSTTNSGTSGLGSNVEVSLYPPVKRCRRAMTGDEEIGLGETRDFLGMQTICNPSSINGWI